MSAEFWIGGAAAVAKVQDNTPSTPAVSNTFTATVKDESNTTVTTVTFAATATTVANVTAGIAAAWALNPIAVSYATGVDNTTKFTLTGANPGVPFYVTLTAAAGGGGGSPTFTANVTTANSGPNDWNTAANWSGNSVPASADDVTSNSRGIASPILYGLYQAGVTLNSLTHYMGSPAIGTTTAALQISVTAAKSFLPATDGSNAAGNLLNVNTGNNATAWNNYGSGNAQASGIAPFTLAGSNASNEYNQYGGTCGIGLLTPGQSCNFPTINVAGGTLNIGSGTTWSTYTNNGGKVTLNSGSSSGTLLNEDGTTTVYGSSKVGTVTANGGTINYNIRVSGDDITTLNMDGGTLDCSGAADALSVGTLALKKGGALSLFSPSQFTVSTAVTIDATNHGSLTTQVV